MEYDDEIPILGCIGEVRQIDFPNMGCCAEHMIGSIHRIAMREFLSRRIVTVWDWEVRTKHMFEDNGLVSIGEVVRLSLGHVNRLKGCGFKTRKEVYDIFILYHIRLNNWSPEHHYSKTNYKF